MKIKLTIAALCAALLTGCGVAIKYSLSGASIPPDAKTFSVAYFTNNTFSTSGNWQTVSIPLSEFAYDRYGNKLGGLKFENLTGMTMFLYTGPYKEATVECSPTICVDNIRVCPINE